MIRRRFVPRWRRLATTVMHKPTNCKLRLVKSSGRCTRALHEKTYFGVFRKVDFHLPDDKQKTYRFWRFTRSRRNKEEQWGGVRIVNRFFLTKPSEWKVGKPLQCQDLGFRTQPLSIGRINQKFMFSNAVSRKKIRYGSFFSEENMITRYRFGYSHSCTQITMFLLFDLTTVALGVGSSAVS